jgi:hypothetical protein
LQLEEFFYFLFFHSRASSPWVPWETWIHRLNSEKANCKCRQWNCTTVVLHQWDPADEHRSPSASKISGDFWLFFPTHASYYLATTPPHYSAGSFVSQQKGIQLGTQSFNMVGLSIFDGRTC